MSAEMSVPSFLRSSKREPKERAEGRVNGSMRIMDNKSSMACTQQLPAHGPWTQMDPAARLCFEKGLAPVSQ